VDVEYTGISNRRVGHCADSRNGPKLLFPKRKNIRLPRQQYEIPSQIFSITICTYNRRPLFENNEYAGLTFNTLRSGPFGKQTELYAACLMPDHIHLLLSPVEENLIDSVNRWKSYTANLLLKKGLTGSCWQRGFYDHALRKEEDIRATAEYIVNNPLRAGIVGPGHDYPFLWHRWMSDIIDPQS
jgi:putative transposase